MSKCARHEVYLSPFSARYCSPEISHLFSPHWKIHTYRKLWISLAKAEKKLGLPITDKQIGQMEANASEIDFDKAHEYEKKFRHDVMAHIHAFGDQCPDAKGIIHLGATSSFVTDNADLIQLKEALTLLFHKLLYLIDLLAKLAKKHASDPCLSYTHYQPAQPTTIGKRISLWLQDFLLDARDWHRLIEEIPFLGAKGATGTQSSFLALFEGDHQKVLKLEKEIASQFHFQTILPISGQTYTRKLDLNILNALESFAASSHKVATDFRLLAHDGEMREPFGDSQVGSSAMPYKRNPIYSERICGLARFAISLSQNPTYTTATQWLERSLDDSSNRRLAIPESFLSIDAILNLLCHIFSDPQIEIQTALDLLNQQLPLLSMENVLMEAVKKGGNRQHLHETLRTMAFHAMKGDHPMETFIHSVEKDKSFHLSHREVEQIGKIDTLIGRAPEQTTEFLATEVAPFLKRHPVGKVTIPSVEI